MPLKRAPRLQAFDYVGCHRYSLTLCVHRRRPVFVTPDDIAPVLSKIQHAATALGFAVIAYCFMPDHLHLLVEGLHDQADLRAFMKRAKQTTSFLWKQMHRGELWQRGYFDHVLRTESDLVVVARYILGNPVRAGLVDPPEAYALSGSLTMEVRDLLGSL